MVSRFLRHLMSLPMEFFTQRHVGDIVSRVAAIEQVARLLSGGLATNALNLISVAFFAAAMAVYDVTLATICVGISLLNVVALRLVSGRLEDLNRSLALERGKLYGSTISIIRTIETLKASGLEDDAFARWAGFQAKLLNFQQRVGFYATVLSMFPPVSAALATAVILGVGGSRVIDGALTIGGLVAFQSLMMSFSAPITALVHLAGGFQAIKADLVRIEDVLSYPVEATARGMPAAESMPAKLSGRIELRNIKFGYSPLEPPLIDGLSLNLEPGMRIALVGASGSGKSTVGRLVCGLLKPWSGEIRYDGMPLGDVPPDVFANSVAYVDQDIFLFEGTVRDNLTLWDRTVPEFEYLAGAQGRRNPCRNRRAPRQLRLHGRRSRNQFQRRTAPADRDCAGARRQSVDPGAGRGDGSPRCLHGATHRRQPAAPRLRLHHHRAPGEHHSGLRRDHPSRQRQGCRTRYP